MSLSAIFLFILILLALVLVHEFGHFIVAKLVGMRVDEFAFGFPPRLFSRKHGETRYSFNVIPLGGYVSIFGENGSEEDKTAHGAHNNPRAFGNRPKWAQIMVLAAGVVMNMVLACAIFIAISYGHVRMNTSDPIYGARVRDTSLVVTEVAKGSPAHKAGIVPGATLTKVTSAGAVAPASVEGFIAFIQSHQNSPFTITYTLADGTKKTTTIAAVYGIIPDKKALGVGVDEIGIIDTTLKEAFVLGFERTVTMTQLTVQGLGTVVKSLIHGDNVLSSLSGPVGIAKVVGETSDYGVTAVLTLVAVLSINLAIFNILPLPALDGGRIVVVLLEAISRRKIPFAYYSWVNTLGFGLLILLLIFVTINDIKG